MGTPDRAPEEKRCLAFGAEATRRIKRVADALIAFGDSGPGRECVTPAEWGDDCCRVVGDAKLDGGGFGARPKLKRILSDFVRGRA